MNFISSSETIIENLEHEKTYVFMFGTCICENSSSLDDLPKNFDIINSLAVHFPIEIYKKQGFVVCGGFILFQPTEAVFKFIEAFNQLCENTCDHRIRAEEGRDLTKICKKGTGGCDDQILLNMMYQWSGMRWKDVDERQRDSAYSPVDYYKIGRSMDKFVIENEPRVDLPEISSIQAMVISEKDVKRGGLITDCLTSWVIHPIISLLTDDNLVKKSVYKKMEIFEYFKEC